MSGALLLLRSFESRRPPPRRSRFRVATRAYHPAPGASPPRKACTHRGRSRGVRSSIPTLTPQSPPRPSTSSSPKVAAAETLEGRVRNPTFSERPPSFGQGAAEERQLSFGRDAGPPQVLSSRLLGLRQFLRDLAEHAHKLRERLTSVRADHADVVNNCPSPTRQPQKLGAGPHRVKR
jgi:hypothetical protein